MTSLREAATLLRPDLDPSAERTHRAVAVMIHFNNPSRGVGGVPPKQVLPASAASVLCASQLLRRCRSGWDIGVVFDKEAAIFTCRVVAALGLVMVVLGTPAALLLRASSGWPTIGLGAAVVGGTMLVISGVALRMLRRD